jgi:hypothetical protein
MLLLAMVGAGYGNTRPDLFAHPRVVVVQEAQLLGGQQACIHQLGLNGRAGQHLEVQELNAGERLGEWHRLRDQHTLDAHAEAAVVVVPGLRSGGRGATRVVGVNNRYTRAALSWAWGLPQGTATR